jgi:hypothetical protein
MAVERFDWGANQLRCGSLRRLLGNHFSHERRGRFFNEALRRSIRPQQ